MDSKEIIRKGHRAGISQQGGFFLLYEIYLIHPLTEHTLNEKGAGMNKEFYTVGEVAKICNINIRTLHYYNDINLLVPEKIDESSHYRYYTNQQIIEIMIIKEYKFRGFSLKDIKELIKRDDLNRNRKMLELKCAEIDKKVGALTVLKKRLTGYIDAVEQSSDQAGNQVTNQGSIFIKEMDETFAAYLDFTGACENDKFNDKFIELLTCIEQAGLEIIGDRYMIFNSSIEAFDFRNMKTRFLIPVKAASEIKGVVCRIPDYQAVSATHIGPHHKLGETYQQMERFVRENRLHVKDMIINRLIIDIVSTQNEEHYVTETLLMIDP